MPNVQNPSKPAGGFRIVTFPKEFEKNFIESIDRRFYIILLVSLALIYGWVIILGNIKYSQEMVDDQIRNRLLSRFYEATIGEEVETESEEGEGFGVTEQPTEEAETREEPRRTGRAESAGTSAAERERARREAARQRGQRRGEMDQAVAGTGVLGELSSGSAGGAGDAIFDALGDGGYSSGAGDLNQVLGSVSGLQSASASSRRSRFGARESGGGGTGTAGIDDLIEGGVGAAGSVSIERSGGFSLKMERASITGRGSRAADRSQEAVSLVVSKHVDAIENCYKREVRLNPNLQGSVTVQFTITPDGRVDRARIANSTLRNRNAENCILQRVRSWRFKRIDDSEGEVTFSQKYVFGT